MSVTALLLLALLSGTAQIVARNRGLLALHYLLKPGTMLLIITIAWLHPGDDPRYRCLLLAGLAFGLCGDVLLMLPRNLFAAGLVSFLVGHLFYAAAWIAPPPGPLPTLLVAGLLGGGSVALYRYLLPDLGEMKLPVAAYVAVIGLVTVLAVLRALDGSPSALAAAAGALLFVLSDGLLAVDRFRLALPAREALVMASYYGAQACIACSVALA
jgi:uncharacterized membrane protein YhhN